MSARELLDFDKPAEGQPIFIDLAEVISRVGIGRTKIYELVALGEFPRQAKIGSSSYWELGEIIEWMRSHLAARYGSTSVMLKGGACSQGDPGRTPPP